MLPLFLALAVYNIYLYIIYIYIYIVCSLTSNAEAKFIRDFKITATEKKNPNAIKYLARTTYIIYFLLLIMSSNFPININSCDLCNKQRSSGQNDRKL